MHDERRATSHIRNTRLYRSKPYGITKKFSRLEHGLHPFISFKFCKEKELFSVYSQSYNRHGNLLKSSWLTLTYERMLKMRTGENIYKRKTAVGKPDITRAETSREGWYMVSVTEKPTQKPKWKWNKPRLTLPGILRAVQLAWSAHSVIIAIYGCKWISHVCIPQALPGWWREYTGYLQEIQD